MSDNPERDLAKQTAAAQALREAIATLAGNDPEAIRDTIEGGTNLHESIAAVCNLIREDEILIDGIDAMMDKLGARHHRLKTRTERCRAALEQAMTIGELKTLTLPDVSLTLKSVPPGIEVINEELIPAEFWKEQEPKLDKTALKAALKDGRAVAGATLGNGGITIQLRRS